MAEENAPSITKKSGKSEIQSITTRRNLEHSKEIGLNLLITAVGAIVTGFASAAGAHLFRSIAKEQYHAEVIPLRKNG